MKKILITGATGFVGWHVARKITDCHWGSADDVVCLARPGSERKFLSRLPVKVVEGDLNDPESLKRAMEKTDVLFHVAADYRLWSRDPRELFRTNVGGTENILQAAKEAEVGKIIYTSSVSAVGRPENAPFCGNETMDPTPEQLIGPYKKSKYQAELVARKFAGEGLPIVIVNPSTPVGSHDVKPTQTGRIVLDFMRRKIPAYLGETGLNLIDVEDVAEGHLLASEKGRIGERYILGNRNMTLKEILDLLSGITGIPAPVFKVPYSLAYAAGACSTWLASLTGRAPRIPLDGVRMGKEKMYYDSSKALRELGLPQSPISEALRKAVDFFKENGYV